MAKANVKNKKLEYGNPYMTKDMSRIILKLIVLKKIQKGEIYSYALIKEFDNPKIAALMKKHGMTVKNDVYNTVGALEKSGYIRVKAKVEEGRIKKYYYITDSGVNALRDAKLIFLQSMKGLVNILK